MTELGYRGNEEWTDMSNFVVHFTKGAIAPGGNGQPAMLSPADVLWKILAERLLKRGPDAWGAAVNLLELKDTQRSVCFSEIPLGYLSRLVARRKSSYGIAFRKAFVFAKGGAPVWYVDRGSPVELLLSQMRREGLAHRPDYKTHAVWRITPFTDHPFHGEGRQWRFEWEREWRVPLDVQFTDTDVAFLFLEEAVHASWRDAFTKLRASHGLSYPAKFIDPLWPWDRMVAECKPLATS